MKKHAVALILMAIVLSKPQTTFADFGGITTYNVDLTNPQEAAKKAKWSDPDRIAVAAEGIGWGNHDDKASRDFWLETEPIGIGLSWRPTTIASIKATVDHPGTSGMLYARYSSDGKNWTAWQYLEAAKPSVDARKASVFQGTLRVPYREGARYQQLRMEYAGLEDVPWSSDEEALVKEIFKREPRFFEKTTPFIGYVQFLYEAQLQGGQRVKGLRLDVNWWVGGKHQPPKDESSRKGRDTAWRFKAP